MQTPHALTLEPPLAFLGLVLGAVGQVFEECHRGWGMCWRVHRSALRECVSGLGKASGNAGPSRISHFLGFPELRGFNTFLSSQRRLNRNWARSF